MKEITTNGKTILLAEVPEDATKYSIGATCHDCNKSGIWHCAHADTCGNNIPSLKVYTDNTFITSIDLPSGNYEILGKSLELSEEQMNGIVHEPKKLFAGMYFNYKKGANICTSVQESYLSLLEANGIVDRCLLPKPNNMDYYGQSKLPDYIFQEDLEQWQETQSKVKHYLALKRI